MGRTTSLLITRGRRTRAIFNTSHTTNTFEGALTDIGTITMTFTHKTLPLSFLIAIGFPILLMAQADRIENLAVAHVAACREPAQAALRAWVPEGQQHIGILA